VSDDKKGWQEVANKRLKEKLADPEFQKAILRQLGTKDEVKKVELKEFRVPDDATKKQLKKILEQKEK
jgi:hypothetical protein